MASDGAVHADPEIVPPSLTHAYTHIHTLNTVNRGKGEITSKTDVERERESVSV